jgi:putative endopeptidase
MEFAMSMRPHRWAFTTAILFGLLAGCSRSSPPGDAAHPQAQPLQSGETGASAGIDVAAIDRSVQPGDDFFSYANGGWLRTTEIPADRPRVTTFSLLNDQAEKRTADLIRELGATTPAAGTNARKVADSYAAYLDEDAIERRGLDGLKPLLDAIDAVKSREDLARLLGERMRADVDPLNNTNFHTDHLFGLFVTQALEDPSRNIAYLLQGGLAMPSRDYYLSDDAAMRGYREKYSTYVTSMLMLAGTRDPQTAAAAVVDLETKIAKAQASLVESEDVHAANNLWKTADFKAKARGLDWNAFFAAAGLADQADIDVWQPAAVAGLAKLTADAPLESWKALLRFHTLDRYAPWLPKAYAELAFDFHQRTLLGVPEQRDRWKLAVAITSADLGDAVGQLYVERYFPASSKARIDAMVANIVAAFRSRIDALAWMTPATKANAKAKLASLKVGIGYPDTWQDYSTLDVRADDALGNHLRAELQYLAAQKAKLGRAPDHGEWWMTPQTVNAVNLPVQNALNFPAAILEPPFFDASAEPAANYGAIGAVIGHEVSHSFDNLGAEFDADGRLKNWWTPEDAERFKAAGQALADQYDAYEALPALHLNGKQTLGENIADLAGLQAAYLAYHASLAGAPAPVIDGLTADQRLFLAYAQNWRVKIRDGALRAAVNTDVHAPGRFRAATVRNLDAWYAAFDVQPAANEYLAPDDRVRIW